MMEDSVDLKPLLDVKEVAKILRFSPSYVYEKYSLDIDRPT